MKKDTATDISRYTIDDKEGFFVDIITTEDLYEAFLGHRKYGAMMYMFGSPKVQSGHVLTRRDFCDIVEANIPEYLADFENEYMF